MVAMLKIPNEAVIEILEQMRLGFMAELWGYERMDEYLGAVPAIRAMGEEGQFAAWQIGEWLTSRHIRSDFDFIANFHNLIFDLRENGPLDPIKPPLDLVEQLKNDPGKLAWYIEQVRPGPDKMSPFVDRSTFKVYNEDDPFDED